MFKQVVKKPLECKICWNGIEDPEEVWLQQSLFTYYQARRSIVNDSVVLVIFIRM
jgi:hypothetical protein